MYLRSGQANPHVILHCLSHIGDELLDLGGEDLRRGNGLGDLAKDRVTEGSDAEDGHGKRLPGPDNFGHLGTLDRPGQRATLQTFSSPNFVQEPLVADPKNKWEDNTPGAAVINGKRVSFFVDKECILCSVCSDTAPSDFRMSGQEAHDICYKQPENKEELDQCYEAMENCPVEAIGDNG